MNLMSQLKTIRSILVTSAVSCFALVPKAPAAPQTALPGFNTADGDHALFNVTTGIANTGIGWFSLQRNTDGSFNTAVGAGTLLFNIGDQSTGDGTQNTAIGTAALLNNISGSNNMASGALALFSNAGGSSNTANGFSALFSNTDGGTNTATGDSALFSNTIGSDNTATGFAALSSNTEGNFNTAIGGSALNNNSTGGFNTASGASALFSNTDGGFNTATGFQALGNNTTGSDNTATGFHALNSNTVGADNTATGAEVLVHNTEGNLNAAVGRSALSSNTTGDRNTALGNEALRLNTTGSGNIALGLGAGTSVTTANNVVCIGHLGANVDDSCFIGHVRDAVVAPDAAQVLIDSAGKLGTTNGSSRRLKKEIKPMTNASETILALQPVTFHYKTDKTNTPQFGLIAEEVAEVNPDLVVRDKNGELVTVRYDAVNAMLLNEFLKEHKKVEEQQSKINKQDANIADLKSAIARQQEDFRSAIVQQQKATEVLTAQLKGQATQIQKVSAQVKINRSAPQVAVQQ